jgi:hypothetical protein
MLAWKHGVDLGTPRCQYCSCKWSEPSGAHDLREALESLEEEPWTHLMECPCIRALHVYDITLEIDMCTLGV